MPRTILGVFSRGTNTAIDLVANIIYDGTMPGEKLMEAAGVSEPEVLGAMAINEMAKMEKAADTQHGKHWMANLEGTLHANSEQENDTTGSEKDSSVEHSGHVDYSDREAVIRRLEQEEYRTVSFEYEVNCIVTSDGEVWIVSGDAVSVDPTQIPRDLKGSCSYHNHPSDKTWYSFSAEDAAFFIENGQDYSKASDNIFEYVMQRRPDTIVANYEEVYNRFREIRRTEIMEMMWDGIIDREFDEYHEIMKILSREYKFDYKRRKRNGGK